MQCTLLAHDVLVSGYLCIRGYMDDGCGDGRRAPKVAQFVHNWCGNCATGAIVHHNGTVLVFPSLLFFLLLLLSE